MARLLEVLMSCDLHVVEIGMSYYGETASEKESALMRCANNWPAAGLELCNRDVAIEYMA